MPTEDEVDSLAEAMWQLLDDMGRNGTSVCVAAKAAARIAYEPFRQDEIEYDDWMTFAEAKSVIDSLS